MPGTPLDVHLKNVHASEKMSLVQFLAHVMAHAKNKKCYSQPLIGMVFRPHSAPHFRLVRIIACAIVLSLGRHCSGSGVGGIRRRLARASIA